MSAFLISKKNNEIDLSALERTWIKVNIRKIEVTDYNCYLAFNPDTEESSRFYEDSKNWIYVAGTFFYKDYSFKDSVKFLLEDFHKDEIDFRQMFGHYALLIFHNQKLHILNDALGAIRIFSDTSRTMFSTSFLGLWFAHTIPLELNKLAVYEKLNTGYITAPDTLVKNIHDITFQQIETTDFIKKRPTHIEYKKGNRDIYFQVKESQKYFDKLFKLAEGGEISLGLSGGFDSRMLLGLLLPYQNKYLFTHNTDGVHKEMEIAVLLSKTIHHNIHIKKTKNTTELNTEEAEKLLTNLIYFFDGRTANNSGSFSEVGTYEYSHFHINGKAFGINGKGGEVFRNYYNIPNRYYTFTEWFTLLESYSSLDLVLPRDLRNQMLGNIKSKIKERLPVEYKWNRWHIQRYYSEIRQADCEASIIYAHNKITRYIAPYLDANLLSIAYQSYNQVGNNSNFQMKFIQLLNPDLAAVNSNYGHSFSKVPVKHKIKESIIRLMPLKIRKKRLEIAIKKAENMRLSKVEKKALEFFKEFFTEINADYCFSHYAQKNVVTNLAYLLMEAQKLNKIKLK